MIRMLACAVLATQALPPSDPVSELLRPVPPDRDREAVAMSDGDNAYDSGVTRERKRCAALVEKMMEREGPYPEVDLEALLECITHPMEPLPQLPFPHHPNAPE